MLSVQIWTAQVTTNFGHRLYRDSFRNRFHTSSRDANRNARIFARNPILFLSKEICTHCTVVNAIALKNRHLFHIKVFSPVLHFRIDTIFTSRFIGQLFFNDSYQFGNYSTVAIKLLQVINNLTSLLGIKWFEFCNFKLLLLIV